MPRATRHYRLRIRNADDSADALILSSVPGGTNPYLTGRPRGDGQEIDPATGESSIGAYTIEAADVSEIITAALVDGSGRQALIQRRAYIELSTDVGSSWPTVLIPGFVNGYRLVTPMRWAFTVGESRRVEYTRKVWDRVTEKFEQATCLIGGPVRGEWGPTGDDGGWCFRVTASDAGTVTLRPNFADLPIDEDTEHVQITGSNDDDILIALTPFVRNRANRFAAADQALVETAADEDTYPGIVVLVQELDGTEVDYFTPRVQVHKHKDVLLTPKDEIVLVRAGAWAVNPPDTGTIFRFYVWRTTVDEDTPLHIDAHPVDILTDLWDEAGLAYDSTEATAVRGLLGDNTRLMLRIDEPWKLVDVTKMIGGLFGINTRVGTDGELELITTRIRGIAEPASLYDDDDLRSPDTVIFDVDEESIYNTVTVEQQRFVRWKSGMGDRPIDEVVARSHIRSRDLDSEGGGTPDSETFGLRELRFFVPGIVKIDVSGSSQGDDYFEQALALDLFERFGRGGVYGTVDALPTITEKVGEELRLDVSHLPNAGVRGGERILQVVRRTETPAGPQLLLLDSGPNSQFVTAPTFSLAAGAADARKYVDITITNAAALNTAGACLRIQWAAAASEPSSGSLLTGYGTGAILGSFTMDAVDAGSHIWIRMQAYRPNGRPTSYTAWQDVDLTDLTAPSSLSRSAGDDPALNTITFTPGESDIPLEVWQRPQGDPADEARVVDNLKEGSDRVTLTLVPGNSYTIGIRHRERRPFAGVSSTTEIGFTVAGSPDTLPAPTHPFALGTRWTPGSLDGSSGVEPGDWPGDVTDQYAVGLRVRSAIDEGFIEFDMATETAVESGTPGSYSTEETRSVAGVDETYVFMIDVPLDGKLRYMRARHVRVGATASPYTSVVSVLPGEILSPPPPVDPLDITGIVPVTLGGTGVADPSSGVLLLGAATDPTTELAPGAAGGYARSNGSAWARSGLLAADLSGTIPSARLSGVYSGITGLGQQAQALDMGGNNITAVGTLGVTGAATLASTLSVGTTTLRGTCNIESATPAITIWQSLQLNSEDAYTIDKGGSIGFGGVYNSGGSVAGWAAIRGLKESAADGNYGGYLLFATRTHGSATAERMRISSTGAITMTSTLGVTGLVTLADHIVKSSASSYLTLSGGSTTELGANFLLYGENTAGSAKDMRFRSNASTKLWWDDSASLWTFTQAVQMETTLGVTGLATFTGGATVGEATPGDDFLLLRFLTSRPWRFETYGADGAAQQLMLRAETAAKSFYIGDSTGVINVAFLPHATPASGLTDFWTPVNMRSTLDVTGVLSGAAATFSTTLGVTGILTQGADRPITLGASAGQIKIKGAAGGWVIGTMFLGSADTALGGFGAAGNTDALSYFYVGVYASEMAKFSAAMTTILTPANFDAAVTMDSTLGVTGDVTIGSLGAFDSADTPTDRQLLLYNDSISKWQAEDVQLAWGNSDVKAAVLADNTAVAYILEDPGAGADSPVGAPSAPSAPTLYGAHESITLEVVGYSRPADFRYFEWRYSEDNFVADDHALATTTSDKIVHARLDNTTTYYYKVRATDRAANSSSYSSVSNTTPVANGSQAFGVILAAEIGCANLAAIQANIGIITAGQMRDSTNVYGINLGGAGGIPVGWAAGINFENTAVDGMDRYVNFYEGASDGLDFFIKHEHFDLMHDGTARFRGFLDLTAFGAPWGLSSQWGVFRAPSLAHGMTDVVPTDVALDLLVQSTTQGGVTVRGLTGTGSDTVIPLALFGVSGRPSPLTSSVHIYGRKKDGTTTQALADDEPILRVSSIALTSDIAFAVFPKRADFPAEMSCTGEQTFSSTGTQNNVSLDDSVSVFNYTGGSATTITGFSGGYQGRLVYVVNAGVALTIANNNGSSSLGNRVYTGTGASVVFSTQGGFFMRYDGTYWRILALSN